jgi:hypothetical membrane protein
MTQVDSENRRKSGILGLAGVILFVISLVIFGNLNSGFNFKEDFVSKLEAIGEPNAIWWNLIAFALIGLIQIGFGVNYKKILNDKLAGFLLALFGVGLIFTSVPIDIKNSNTPISKVHIVAIYLALAFWLFGLSRVSYNTANRKSIRNRANIAAFLIVTSMVGFVVE